MEEHSLSAGRRRPALLVAAVLAACLCLPGSCMSQPPPFTVGIELPSQAPISPAEERALKEMGIGYVNYYLRTVLGNPDRPGPELNRATMDLCGRLGLDFSIATYQIDPPEECVREAARTALDKNRKGRFRGVVFDELEHIRLLNFDRPRPLADYKRFTSLPQAWEETVAGYEKLRGRFAALDSPVVATHVFPVLLHAAARAGFTVCPKIEKEFYSPVSLAIGMGAALQYGVPLWADCDLWYYDMVPGHSPEEFRSNLLLAYWLGVDLVYVEGSGYNLLPAGSQGIPFSLMIQATPDAFQLTPHGEALRWFAREYVPAHPRSWTFRDARPNIAIVRFDDTDWGQHYASGFTKGLYGTERLPSTPDTRAWFQVWNLLTCGRTNRDGITFFKPSAGMSAYQYRPEEHRIPSYRTRPAQADFHRFFVPLNGAIVFDHTAGYERLKEIPLLFLTGAQVSGGTMEAIRRCVREGAVCVAWGPLAARSGFPGWKSGVTVQAEGRGRWVLTDDFNLPEVFSAIWNLVGRSDEIRYRFGRHEVVLRPEGADGVTVEVDGVRQ